MGIENLNPMGKWIKKFCIDRDLKEADLASAMGIKATNLSRSMYTTGGRKQTWEALYKIRVYLASRHDLTDLEKMTLDSALLKSVDRLSIDLNTLGAKHRNRLLELLLEVSDGPETT